MERSFLRPSFSFSTFASTVRKKAALRLHAYRQPDREQLPMPWPSWREERARSSPHRMSAVALVLQLVRQGDLIVAPTTAWRDAPDFAVAAARGHFDVEFVDLTCETAAQTVTARRPRLLWVETPSNPLLRLTDLACVIEAGHQAGAIVAVDNTFLSPALQRPIEFGADLVVHSTTKYLNGHSDIVGGAVVAADPAVVEEGAWGPTVWGSPALPSTAF